jgi:two-component system, NarL family, invasion response regulator UvrY
MISQTNIMLVDDHSVVRAGVRRLLEQHSGFSVVAEAENGERAYQLFGEHLPDLTVMDLTMRGMGGLETIGRIMMRYPTAKILVLSMHESSVFAAQALKAGAKGYLSKTSLGDELLNALEVILKGRTYIDSTIAKSLALDSLDIYDNPLQQLSAREFEIFRLLAEGDDCDAVADVLKISSKTVSNYQTSIKQKLGIGTSVEMVRIAIRYGVISS